MNNDDLYEKLNIIFLALEHLGVDIKFLDKGVTVEFVFSTVLQFLSDYYSLGEIVPRWQITDRAIAPVR